MIWPHPFIGGEFTDFDGPKIKPRAAILHQDYKKPHIKLFGPTKCHDSSPTKESEPENSVRRDESP